MELAQVPHNHLPVGWGFGAQKFGVEHQKGMHCSVVLMPPVTAGLQKLARSISREKVVAKVEVECTDEEEVKFFVAESCYCFQFHSGENLLPKVYCKMFLSLCHIKKYKHKNPDVRVRSTHDDPVKCT